MHAKAAELGIPFAEYVRRLVALDLGELKRKADGSMIFDLVTDGEPTDIGRDKHEMIADALWLVTPSGMTTCARRAGRRDGASPDDVCRQLRVVCGSVQA